EEEPPAEDDDVVLLMEAVWKPRDDGSRIAQAAADELEAVESPLGGDVQRPPGKGEPERRREPGRDHARLPGARCDRDDGPTLLGRVQALLRSEGERCRSVEAGRIDLGPV